MVIEHWRRGLEEHRFSSFEFRFSLSGLRFEISNLRFPPGDARWGGGKPGPRGAAGMCLPMERPKCGSQRSSGNVDPGVTVGGGAELSRSPIVLPRSFRFVSLGAKCRSKGLDLVNFVTRLPANCALLALDSCAFVWRSLYLFDSKLFVCNLPSFELSLLFSSGYRCFE